MVAKQLPKLDASVNLDLNDFPTVADSKYGPLIWARTCFVLVSVGFNVWAVTGIWLYSGYIRIPD